MSHLLWESVAAEVGWKDNATHDEETASPHAEQIIRKLAEGHKLMAGGMTIEEVCREFGIAESSWHRWLSQYGGMSRRRKTAQGTRDAEHPTEAHRCGSGA